MSPTMPPTAAKATKKSAFSCEPCRRRKVKCGGEQPMCQRCAARHDECVYKLNPTLSYTQRLEDRIKELEAQLSRAITASSPSQAPFIKQESPTFLTATHDTSPKPSHRHNGDDSIVRSFRGLKIDDKGGITYHGATSFFNLPNDRTTAVATVALHTSPADIDCQRRERLVTNAWQQRALENISGVPEPFQHLLNVHWCWIQPLFNFIYRPAFTRDMQSLGPYYSHTLLNAVLSHSIRWAKSDPETRRVLDESYDGGAIFGKHARGMLFDELSRGVCTIPTVQTLLLLSAQECSLGNTTQAWTYSGLAFRLIDHLGICLDGERYPGSVPLSDEDVEIRHRVFWSCYFWDKMISLYLGRSPSLQHSTVSPPQMMFDDSAENELWIPFGATQKTWKYPPSTAHSTSCFLSMCRLSVIFNEILIHMYDPLMQNTEEEVRECLRNQQPALQRWWDELEPFLKIDTVNLPTLAPPSHIVTTNCLYHTFKILLYRPMLTRVKQEANASVDMQNYLVECVTSATSIIAIFDFRIYISASSAGLPQDQQAMRRLKFCIEALGQVKTFSPVIGNALNLITRELLVLGITLDVVVPQHQEPPLPASSPDVPLAHAMYQASAEMPPIHPLITQPLFQSPMAPHHNVNPMALNPSIFEAMSSLEPLSVRVGAIQDSNNASPIG
ncbi:Nitrogen assimilation transcription factor nit-4-like protein [Cladobotryum mycophilum]|uniref:Nitrogen assimilation transcription factor nit-4-like protein n=1 Tax=Cladobotryum mycophilum TaxID=491253 RepID=A0ABR0SKA1_9HYPO